MTRRYRALVRVLCAVALGLGVSGAVEVATTTPHVRPAVAQLQGAVRDVTPTSARAPMALGLHHHRQVPPSIGAALLATAVLVGGVVLSTRRRLVSTAGHGRRTGPVGARGPPVAIGI